MGDSIRSSSSLFEYAASSKTATFTIHKVIRVLAGLTIVSFYLNLVLGCSYVFSCKNFTPSPNYLGCFLGYNRFYVLSLTLLSITMAITYLGIYLEFASKCNILEKIVLKGVGIFTCISLPIIALTNEVNSTHVVDFRLTFYILSYLVMSFNIIWLIVMYLKAGKGIYCRAATKICFNFSVALMICYIFVEIQRYANYTTNNWLINTTVWSISEWVLVTLGIIFVALIGDVNKSFKITFGSAIEGKKAEQQIELEEINIS